MLQRDNVINLNCPHIEMQLKQDSVKTFSKLLCFSSINMCRACL